MLGIDRVMRHRTGQELVLGWPHPRRHPGSPKLPLTPTSPIVRLVTGQHPQSTAPPASNERKQITPNTRRPHAHTHTQTSHATHYAYAHLRAADPAPLVHAHPRTSPQVAHLEPNVQLSPDHARVHGQGSSRHHQVERVCVTSRVCVTAPTLVRHATPARPITQSLTQAHTLVPYDDASDMAADDDQLPPLEEQQARKPRGK